MAEWKYGLAALGWPTEIAWPHHNTIPARIAAVHGSLAEACVVDPGSKVGWVRHVGVRFGGSLSMTPVAGDWIAMSDDEAVEVLPRRTSLTRPNPSGSGVQTLAANVDAVVVTVPVDRGINQKMIERLTVMAWDSGGLPVLALTKCDVCVDVPAAISGAERLVPGVEVVATSSVTGEGVERLRDLIEPGTTAALLGASGAGKTSLLNVLGDYDERVSAVARDGQGRHATTTRRLHFVTGGGVLIDLPGIRALDLSASQEAITDVFSEITELAKECRFSDCSHEHEPDCAVKHAIESGQMPERRLDAWDSIQREIAHQTRKHDPAARADEKAKWKAITKEIRRQERD